MTEQTLDSLDLFPARVITPTIQTDRARLVVDHGAVYLWTEGDAGVQLAAATPIVSLTRVKQAGAPYVIATESGEEWTCSKGSGCGCGSRLRRLNPKTEIQTLQVQT